ncbi:MAG TPA: exosortase system-associated protein, TIGR04073 family [Nitrospiraceae bacterium]|nr:exosortase system-associated protein, TIGR04073 family [Nitrospiraceae bacterium]
MKKWITTVVMCLVLGGGYPAQAEELPPANRQDGEPPVVEKIATKLTRGVVNFTTGWVELPKQIYLVGHNEGLVTGAIRGLIDGLGMFIARTVAGAYEVLTFPLPIPPQYQPMLRPDYVWQQDPIKQVQRQITSH